RHRLRGQGRRARGPGARRAALSRAGVPTRRHPGCYREVTMCTASRLGAAGDHGDSHVSPRPPAPRRRRQLLRPALRVFAERGYHSASMNDIAVEAGVTKPVLYQHFPSKRELFAELLDDVGRELQESITKAVAAAE